MKHALTLCGLLAGPAFADADYPVYRCEGPQLVLEHGQWLYPEEINARHPGLAPRAPMENAVFLDGDRIGWTERDRDSLRALCLDRWERAQAPASGIWDMDGLPLFHTGACGPLPLQRPFGAFPRAVHFGDVFHPDTLLGRSPTGWDIARDEESFTWHAYASKPGEFFMMEYVSYDFRTLSRERIEIAGSFADAFGCTDAFTLSLVRVGD